MNINFKIPSFTLFPYEKDLLVREVFSISNGEAKADFNKRIITTPDDNTQKIINIILKKSTFIDSVYLGGKELKTIQRLIESTTLAGKKRQSTRYLTHGMHEYRGKFNPQIARSILNILDIKPGSFLFDPFCGSGTTLLEASRLGLEAYGCDINPLAVLISKAKLNAFRIHEDKFIENIKSAISFALKNKSLSKSSSREEYLKAWIPSDILIFLENYKSFCNNFEHPEVYLIIASNLIRDYSYQEPSDLRIRRRISPFPKRHISIALLEAAEMLQEKIVFFSKFENFNSFSKATIEVQDIRKYQSNDRFFDVALTSPPYATALPYIDTHRISMVWLDLIAPAEIRPLEESLLGSREITKNENRKFFSELEKYYNILPKQEVLMCSKLAEALNEHDGFRRQAVPALILRYFYDMHKALKNILSMMKPGSSFALIIGPNRTTLGGTEFRIDTPEHIASLAQNVGWRKKELIALQTYKRYGLHAKNGINSESLLILESP
ncbi:DNA methyltransferase [uncultured Desulfovibrio sp.]|uniref:TRM11 family SAM-dependent methyltransferase n=1 Tax=uncultured Desulfovibrio sp. TaxID=167968 RepID=UPI002624F800|nr:DNA methyltransferase [uncultured Desulfovibrio sp.]